MYTLERGHNLVLENTGHTGYRKDYNVYEPSQENIGT